MTLVLSTVKTLSVVFKHDCARFLSVSHSLFGGNKAAFEARRSARMLKKIMTGTKKFTKKPDHSHPSKHLTDFGFIRGNVGAVHHRPVSGRLMRRTEMLNNLFIEQITSLLATGEVAPEFLGLGIQISKVKITADFSSVNVYWYASGTEKDEVIEKLLAKSSGHLRHVLSQLRVIGLVPPINFYKDKTFSKLQEVQNLLQVCDSTSRLGLSPENVEAEEAEIQDSSKDKSKDDLNVFPEDVMTHDILGVKHDLIMGEIMKAIAKKSEKKQARQQQENIQSLFRMENLESDLVDANSNLGTLELAISDHRKRQTEFLKYLKRQQAEKSKELRRGSVEAKEREFYREVVQERVKNQLLDRLEEIDDLDDNEIDDNDYHEIENAYYQNMRENFK